MIFDANATNILIFTFINLNMMLTGRIIRKNKSISYPIFSEKDDKDVNDFISDLKKVFTVNNMLNNRKYIVTINCLKKITANFYDSFNGIIN